MNKKITCYLGGKMTGLDFNTMNMWRSEATRLLEVYDIKTINPVDFYNFNMNPESFTDKECENFDLIALDHSDILLINLDYPDSIGTAIESFYTDRILHKPVIAFGTTDNHPWIKNHVTKFCTTMSEAVEYIHDYYQQIL